jgi:hypothetical protein
MVTVKNVTGLAPAVAVLQVPVTNVTQPVRPAPIPADQDVLMNVPHVTAEPSQTPMDTAHVTNTTGVPPTHVSSSAMKDVRTVPELENTNAFSVKPTTK